MSKQEQMLAQLPINKLLLKLAIPATIAMLGNALYNTVDGIFIGRGVGSNALGGVGIAFSVQMIIIGIAMMIAMGGASIVSRALGAKNYKLANQTLANIFVLTVLGGILFTVFGLVFLKPLVLLLGASPILRTYTEDYLAVIFIGTTFTFLSMIANVLIRSEGRANEAMRLMLIGFILNIILDPLFIFSLQLGVRGAAIATVLSRFIASLYAIRLLLAKTSVFSLAWSSFRPKLEIYRDILIIGLPTFIRQAGASFLIALVMNLLTVYAKFEADLYINIFSIVNRIMLLLFMPLFGIVQAFQPIAGYSYGAQNFTRVKEVIKVAALWTMGYGLVIFLLLRIIPAPLFLLFTEEKDIISQGIPVLQTIFLLLPFIGFQIIGASYFQSAGQARSSLFLNLLRQVILLIPFVLIFPHYFGLWGIFYSYPLADASSFLITAGYLWLELRNLGRREKLQKTKG